MESLGYSLQPSPPSPSRHSSILPTATKAREMRGAIRSAVAEGSSSGNPRRIRRIPSLGPSLPRLTSRRNTQESRLHSTTIPQPRSSHSQTNPNHYSTILRAESKNDSDSTIPHPRFSRSTSTTTTTKRRVRQICRAPRFVVVVVESDLKNRGCGMVESESFLDSTRRMVESWLRDG